MPIFTRRFCGSGMIVNNTMTHRTKMKPFVVTDVPGLPVGLNPSASIELLDTTSGFLPNRMTTEQRDAIEQPEEGMFIYNIDDPAQYQYYKDGEWTNFINPDLTLDSLEVTSLTVNSGLIAGSIGTTNVATTNMTVYGLAVIQTANVNAELQVGGILTALSLVLTDLPTSPGSPGTVYNNAGALYIS
jgi:hypothetical protein